MKSKSIMIRNKKRIKVIGVNLGLLLVLIGFVVSTPIVISQSYRIISKIIPALDVGFESSLVTDYYSPHEQPAYEGVDWAEQHFIDLKAHDTLPTDYLGWRYAPLKASTINISEFGIRKTVNSTGTSTATNHIYWMFGGSTMFGWGSNDANTIPSLLSSALSSEAVNFGTDAYIALQGVIRLASEYSSPTAINDPPRTIIFMDGINDVDRHCRVQSSSNLRRGYRSLASGTSIPREAEQPFVLKSVALTPRWLLQPALSLIDKFRDSKVSGFLGNDPADIYLCDDQQEVAETTAAALVNDWVSAKSMTETQGDRFLAVLQPVSYLSNVPSSQLKNIIYGEERQKQYEVVYPLIRRLAEAADIEFLDLTEIFDGHDDLYIDPLHYSPRGNEYIVNAIVEALADKD